MDNQQTPETDAAFYEDFARKLERERDEWRKKIDLSVDPVKIAARLAQAESERDEAREMAQQLIHIASHCLGWHENANPETITEAIKRWNASTKK